MGDQMRKTRKWRHSLLAVLLVLAIVCLTAAGGLVLGIVNRSLSGFRAYVEESEKTETAGAADMLAADIATLQMILYQYLSDSELLKVKLFITENMLGTRYEQSVKHLWAQIRSVQASLSLSVTVTIYLPEYQWFITLDNSGTWPEKERKLVESVMAREYRDVFTEAGQIHFIVSGDVGVGAYGTNVFASARVQQYAMNRYLKQFEGEEGDAVFCLALDRAGENELFAFSRTLWEGLSSRSVLSLLQSGENGVGELENGGKRYLATWRQVGSLPLKLCQLTPMETLDRQWHAYRMTTIIGYSVVMLLLALMIIVTAYFIRRPIRRMDRAMRRIEEGDFSTRIEPTWSTEFQQMFDQFNRMCEHTQRYIRQEYELRLLHSRAELKQLQYQISPHFLYNTYFTLRAMLMDEEYEQAEQLALLMGNYLRYITDQNREYATLGEEIEHAEAYMRIQQIRFGGRVQAEFAPCPEKEKQMQVPKILLQPLIENAFEHGVRHRPGKGMIRVSFAASEAEIRIRVEDSGQDTPDETIRKVRRWLETDESPEGESVALLNISRRLRAACPEGSGLTVSRSELGGFCSEITIRKEKPDVPHDDRG